MEQYNYILEIFKNSIIPVLITLYLTERVKGSVKNSFDKKLEDVKKGHTIEISRFQTELTHLKSKDNFKFTKLHEKRLIVLEKTYMYINIASESLKMYVSQISRIISNSPFDDNEDEFLKDEFVKIIDEFTLYFNHNRIYFDETVENLLQEFFTESILIFAVHFREGVADDNLFSLKQLNEKLLPIKKQIEIKFRELLGE